MDTSSAALCSSSSSSSSSSSVYGHQQCSFVNTVKLNEDRIERRHSDVSRYMSGVSPSHAVAALLPMNNTSLLQPSRG